MDCSRYENCSSKTQIDINLQRQDTLNMIAVGCWGVYCDDGEYIIVKYKKGQVTPLDISRGQRQVSEALIKYTEENKITDMFLAGDNVYQLGISKSDPEKVYKFLEEKREMVKRLVGTEVDPLKNFDIDLQISQGFENCFRRANIDRFFLAIGNHDIENCQVLNKEFSYQGWNIPSLYYNVLYHMKNFSINIIVLDTNMFEDEPVNCLQKPFAKEQIDTQVQWALEVSKRGDWNIVIGHIPYIANGHKKDKHPVIRNVLKKLIENMSPQLYICADEHNQQFIETDKTGIVIAGSGGTQLDPILKDNVYPGTLYMNSTYGFVVYNIDESELKLSFISAQNKTLFSHSIKR